METVRRVPALPALTALAHVAETRSFTEAAARLHLTQSAVSRQIQQLEEHYGVALFERSSRQVSLTPQGEQVLAVAQRILGELAALERALKPANPERPFRIRIFVSLAVRWLLPRLTSFYAAHPRLALSIETVGGEAVDTDGDCDAYVLYLRDGLDDRALLPLFDEFLIPVCAPALASGLAPPRSVGELAAHPLIHGSPSRFEWTTWLQAHGEAVGQGFQHVQFNLDDLALDAASRGLGVAVSDQVLAQDALTRGSLVVPFGEPLKTGGVYALWLSEQGAGHPARDVILEWFEGQCCD